jgi:hypothetical protein
MQRPNTFLICSMSVFTALVHINARVSKPEAGADALTDMGVLR